MLGLKAMIGTYSDHAWGGPVKNARLFYEAYTGTRLDQNNKRIIMPSQVPGSPNVFKRITCHNIDAAYRMQGDGVAGVWATEIVHYDPMILAEFTQRVTPIEPYTKSLIIYDCNPEGEQHWVKTEYIDKADEMGISLYNFNENDNYGLTRAAWEQTKRGPGSRFCLVEAAYRRFVGFRGRSHIPQDS